MSTTSILRRGLPFAAALALALPAAAQAPGETADATTAAASRSQLLSCAPLPNAPGRTLALVRVDLPPGAVVAAHRHSGTVTAVVLAGTVRSRLNDAPAADYAAGASFTEPPGTLHTYTGNPSPNEPAALLAVFVTEDGCEHLVQPAH